MLFENSGNYDFHYVHGNAHHVVLEWTIHVEPELPHGVHVDGLCIQTVLTRALGPMDEWVARLRVAHMAKYNMVHFTPVEVGASMSAVKAMTSWQELGGSQSGYSIRNHMRVDPHYLGDSSFGACRTVVTSHHTTPHHTTSHHITSHHTTPHHITSHHITSHHITCRRGCAACGGAASRAVGAGAHVPGRCGLEPLLARQVEKS